MWYENKTEQGIVSTCVEWEWCTPSMKIYQICRERYKSLNCEKNSFESGKWIDQKFWHQEPGPYQVKSDSVQYDSCVKLLLEF